MRIKFQLYESFCLLIPSSSRQFAAVFLFGAHVCSALLRNSVFSVMKNVILFVFADVVCVFLRKRVEKEKKVGNFFDFLHLFFKKVLLFSAAVAVLEEREGGGAQKTPDESRGFVGSVGRAWRCAACVGNLVLTIGTLARVVVENDFAHAHGFGRHFHIFVFANVFQRFFQ